MKLQMEEKHYEEELRERRRKRSGKFSYLLNAHCCYRLPINDKRKISICIHILFISTLLIFPFSGGRQRQRKESHGERNLRLEGSVISGN